MELLILSKLKWDLTAVTAYDYLDHMINTLQQEDEDESTNLNQQAWSKDSTEIVRQITERIVLLCATDSNFAIMTPSLIASAALIAALRHGHPKKQSLNNFNLNQITAKLKSVAKFEMVSCSLLAGNVFFQRK